MENQIDPVLQKIAKTNHTILITGKTGTGKSHLAKKIHELSERRTKRFVAINLATLHENILESELFGHERGAYSGADQKRIGKLEFGNEGTVFLDEIGELSLRMQMKLLEALNSKTISPLGSNREMQLDVRIIAATNRSLEEMVINGTFREDLYYRLNSFQLELPPLENNKEWIEKLIKEFSQESALKQGKRITSIDEEFMKVCMHYKWPGNIRELKNAIEFSVAMNADDILRTSDLPPYIRKKLAAGADSHTNNSNNVKIFFESDFHQSREKFEKNYLEEMLKRNDGKINLTAKNTKLSKVTLIEKIRKYNIDVNQIKFSRYLEAQSV